MYHTICFQNWALISVVLARFLKSLLTCLKSTKQALRGYRTYHIVKRGRNVYLRQVPANDDDQGIDIWAVEKDLWAPLPSFESFVVGLDLIQSFWFIVLDRYSKWKLQSAGRLFQNLQRGAMRCHLGPCCLGMSRGVIEKRQLRKGVFPVALNSLQFPFSILLLLLNLLVLVGSFVWSPRLLAVWPSSLFAIFCCNIFYFSISMTSHLAPNGWSRPERPLK